VLPPQKAMAHPRRESQNLIHIPGCSIATVYFSPQLPPKLEFATDTFAERSGFELSVPQRVPDRGSRPL
jgi:hypothetical protein